MQHVARPEATRRTHSRGDALAPPKDPRAALREMQALAGVVSDLESQQERMISAADALKRELDEERKRRLHLEARTEDLQQQLHRTERALADHENLQAEVRLLTRERTRLEAEVHELSRFRQSHENTERRHGELVTRLHAARADLVAELDSVESQFERAMEMVSQLRAQLAAAREAADGARAQLRGTEERLAQSLEERGSLLEEVDQSRAALEEIRRSLADACSGASEDELR